MITRDALTKIFLKQWGKSVDTANVKLYSREWWQCNREHQQHALRLTDAGLHFLQDTIELRSYEIPFTEHIELSPQTIIFLEKYVDCPYHLTSQSIIVFSEKKGFELSLFSDDIRKYGLIKAINEREKDSKNT